MKKELRRKEVLKKILILTLMFCFLSNYFSIIMNIGISFASENLEFNAESTSKIDEVTQSFDIVNENTDTNTNSEDFVDPEYTIDTTTTTEQEISEENEQNADNNENKPNDLSIINAESDFEIDKCIKYDNYFGKGIVVEGTFRYKIDLKENNNVFSKITLNMPTIDGISAENYKIEKIPNDVSYNYNEFEKKIYFYTQKDISDFQEISFTFLYNSNAFNGKNFKLDGQFTFNDDINSINKDILLDNEIKESQLQLATYNISNNMSSKYKGQFYANTVLENKEKISYTTTDTINISNYEFTDKISIIDEDLIILKNNEEKKISDLCYKTTSINIDEFNNVLGTDGIIEIYNQNNDKIGEISQESEKKGNSYIYKYPKYSQNIQFKINALKSNGTLNLKNEKYISGNENLTHEEIKSFQKIKSTSKERIFKSFEEKNSSDNSDIDVPIQEILSSTEMLLEDTKTKIDLEMSNNKFSTYETNEVEFYLTLKTDSEEYEIFKNPKIQITFPYSIDDVEIKNMSLLYKNGLSIDKKQISKNDQGETVLNIELSGAQNKYLTNSNLENTMIDFVAKINLNKMTSSNIGNLKLTYQNECGTITSYEKENKLAEEFEIKYVSLSGLLKSIKLENTTDSKILIDGFNEDKCISKIDALENGKLSNVSMTIVNNYKKDIKNLVIIGKLPKIENKDINGNDLYSTFDTNLDNHITTNGLIAKVYYSEELNPEMDSDSWSENIENYNNIKSFKIAVENQDVHQGETIGINYNLVIPENIEYNKATYGEITTYYELNEGIVKDSTIYGLETEKRLENLLLDASETKVIELGDITGKNNFNEIENTENISNNEVGNSDNAVSSGAQSLEVKSKVTLGGNLVNENTEINERQIIRYTYSFTNNSNEPITNVKIKGNANNARLYYWNTFDIESDSSGQVETTGEWIEDKDESHKFDTVEFDKILPGETKTFTYQVVVKKIQEITDEEKNVFGNVYIKSDQFEEKEIETQKNKIKNANLEISLTKGSHENVNAMVIYTGEEVGLKATVKNISNTVLKNVAVSFMLPDNLLYSDMTKLTHPEYNLNVETISTGTKVTVVLDELELNEEQNIYLYTSTAYIDISKASEDFEVVLNVEENNNKYVSNEYTRTITQDRTIISSEFYGNKPNKSKVKDNENLKYTFIAKNEGAIEKEIEISSNISSGLNIESIKLYRSSTGEENTEETNSLQYKKKVIIQPSETLKLEISGVVNIEDCYYEQPSIISFVNISYGQSPSTVEYQIEYPEGYFDDEDDNIDSKNEENDNTSSDDIENKDNTNDSSQDKNNQNNNSQENDNQSQYNQVNTKENESPKDNDVINLTFDHDYDNESENLEEEKIKLLDNSEFNETSNNSPNKNLKQQLVNSIVEGYDINGTVWLDSNEDSMYDDSSEKGLSNYKVMLFKSNSNNKIDIEKPFKETSCEDGKYIFKNIESGSYIIAIEYDNSEYGLCQYKIGDNIDWQSKGIAQIINNRNYAITDVIDVENDNIYNINFGFIQNKKMDLEISSYVEKVKIKNSKENKEEKFDEASLSKVEVSSKYINETELTATFVIKIKNNGNIPGYATQIQDIIPEGWEFDKKLNSSWTQGNDRTLYTTSIAGQVISPGNSKELKLILKKKMTGESTGVFSNKVMLTEYSNKYEILDNNSANNFSQTDLVISIKTGAIINIIFIVFTILIGFIVIFSINRKLANINSNKKRKIVNVILSVILVTVVIQLLFIIKVLANDVGAINLKDDKGKQIINYWAAGKRYSFDPSKSNSINYTSQYENLMEYMTNFYGHGDRTSITGLLCMRKAEYKSLRAVRTMMCMHASNITYSGDKEDDVDEDALKAFTFAIAVDSGWNNGYSYYYGRMYGDADDVLLPDGESVEDYENKSVASDSVVQMLSYLGFRCEIGSDGKSDGTGTWDHGATTNKDNKIWGNYKTGLSYVLKNYSSIRSNIKKVTGLNISNSSNASQFDNEVSLKNFSDDMTTFSQKNRELLYSASSNYNEQKKNNPNATISARYKYVTSNSKGQLRTDRIRVSDATDKSTLSQTQTITAENTHARYSVENFVENGIVNYYVDDNKTYITGIKITFPLEGRDGYINNRTIIEYKNNENKWVEYKGKIYTKSSGKLVEHSQDAKYGLNTDNGTTFYNKTLYIPVPSDINSEDTEDIIRVYNGYNTYSSRLIYCQSSTQEQNQGVLRGIRLRNKSYVKYKCEQYKTTVSKSVVSIDGSTSNTTYVENGCEVKYKIDVKNLKTTIKNVKISDILPSGITFKSFEGNGWTRNGNTLEFTYSGNINRNETKTLYVIVNVTANSSKDSNEVLKNNVKINYIGGTIQKAVVYDRSNGTNNLENGSVLESSAQVTMKRYSATVTKNITGNKSYFEIGDTITYEIKVKNSGNNGDLYGKFNSIVLSDTISNNLENVSISGTSWSRNGNNFTYSGSLNPGNETTVLKISGKVKSNPSSKSLYNKVQITVINNHHNNNVKDYTSGKLDDDVDAKIKSYKIKLDKYIDGINGVVQKGRESLSEENKKQKPLSIELGDAVSFRIVIKNDGDINNEEYGNINNITVIDSVIKNSVINECMTLVEIQEPGCPVSTGTGVLTSGNWTVTPTENAKFSINYSGTINKGDSVSVYLAFRITNRSYYNDILQNKIDFANVKNKNNIVIPNLLLEGKKTSSDYLKYLKYSVNFNKNVTEITDNNSKKTIFDRSTKNNTEKYNNPVEVEKGYNVLYQIIVKNIDETSLKEIVLKDTYEGITINKEDIKVYIDNKSVSSDIEINNGLFKITLQDSLLSNQTLKITVNAKVTITNLRLTNCENNIEIISVKNKNDIYIVNKDDKNLSQILNYNKTPALNETLGENNKNKDYIRLKDLVVAGTVWEDTNRDGKIDSNEPRLDGIQVNLYDVTNKKKTTTYTDKNGYYTFSSTNGEAYEAGATNLDKKMVIEDGRVVKAQNKNQTTGIYNQEKDWITYYVEFEYNGVRYRSTEYAGKTNIIEANNIKEEYKIDSNAAEYNDVRETFDKKLETISYNQSKGKDSSGKDITSVLEYEKGDHISEIQRNNTTTIKAQSFIDPSKKGIDGIQNGEINYLWFKYNNNYDGETEYLKYINLGLTTRKMDLSISQDVHSIKNTVNGNQMTYTYLQSYVTNSSYGGAYVTGGVKNPLNYVFNYYASDYYYNHTKYKNKAVIDYKQNTELNSEITYKAVVKNNSVNDKENVYAIIRELSDFYSVDFIKYDPTTNTKKIKVINDQGYLDEITINKIEAWYESTKDGKKVKKDLVISNTPKYPQHAKVNLAGKYNVLYLTGFDDLKIAQGDSFEVYIKFVVDTKANTTELKLGDKNNIIEINSYSTYYLSNNKPAGYVDINSNPGNLGIRKDKNKAGSENTSIEDYNQYENDAFKTGITVTVQNSVNPNNGQNNENYQEGKLERVLKGSVWDDARSEAIWNTAKADKIENANDVQYAGNGIMNINADKKYSNKVHGLVFEPASNSKKSSNKLIHDETTDSFAKGINVNLVEIIKIPNANGERIYEEMGENIKAWKNAVINTRSSDNGTYKIESFVPGNYIVRFQYGEDFADVTYNGQEYKSTKYYNIDNVVGNTQADADKTLNKLEEAKKNDARDDEIRRLEVIRYSEVVNNQKTEQAQKQKAEDYDQDFMKNTNVNADTVAFPVRTEKTTYDVKSFNFEQTNKKIFKIENIDFGLEYRPEVDVSINEYLSEIKLTTNDGKILTDIKFDNVYELDANGNETENILETVVNKEKSVGYENLQYLPNVNDVKGLAYLNIDEDLLQGCTIDITYVFSVKNDSEIDRISNLLYNLRYKNDSKENERYFDDVYTAAGTARNELYNNYYSVDENGDVYGTKDKIGTNGYYGKYVGSTYYSGVIGDDVISKLKVDMILDYVDNNMTMSSTKNVENNKYWKATTNEELNTQGLVYGKIFREIEDKVKENGQVSVNKSLKLLDVKGIAYDVDTRHNLVVSVDDKISSSDEENLNKSLSRYLTPYISNPKDGSGIIYMVASKVVSGNTDTENMIYDNSAEIIQYTSSTGRVTSLGTTVGNLEMAGNTDYSESDSDFTERVTLAPPTGLERMQYYISVVKDQLIIISITICVVIIAIILRKKLKNVKIKVFYK